MLTLFPIRLDEKSKQAVERLALKNGVPKSAIVRNCVRLVLCDRCETTEVERIINRVKRERKELLFGRGENEKT
ncbi:ribbon-helix-helix protein, CopG family [Candidatus Bathyarchaeota archaeon]|nr:ribbon-helix-helix protein, CopG family [Candidatus Bathyarchaeota archaeon]